MATNIAQLAIQIEALGSRLATVELEKVEGSGRRAAKGLEGVSSAATAVAGALAGLGVAAVVRDVFRAGDELTKSTLALDGAARLTGTSLGTLKGISRGAQQEFGLGATTANGLATELSKLAGKAGEAGKATDGLRAFINLGAARGYTAAESLKAIQQAALGIDEGTDKLFGKNPSVLYAEFAAKIGKTAEALTDQQKAQALLNAAIEDGARVGDAYSRFLATALGQSAALQEQTERMKQGFAELLTPMRDVATGVGMRVVQLMAENGPLVAGIGAAVVALGALAVAVRGATAAFAILTANPVVLALAGIGLAVGAITTHLLTAKQAATALRNEMAALAPADLASQVSALTARRRELRTQIAGLGGSTNGIPGVKADATNVGAGARGQRQQASAQDVARLNAELQQVEARLNAAIDLALVAEASRTTPPPPPPAAGGKPKKLTKVNGAWTWQDSDAAGGRLAASVSARDAETQQLLYGDGTSTGLAGNGMPNMEALDASLKTTLDKIGENGLLKQLADRRDRIAAMASSIGDTLVGALASGIERALATGRIGEGFKALSGALLSGLGGAMIEFGKASLLSATLMEKIQKSLAGFLPGGAIAASLLMIAAGATLQGVAGRAFGGMGGGGAGYGGGYSAELPRWDDRTSQIAIGARSSADTARQASRVEPRGSGAPVYLTVIGADDPSAQRQIMTLVQNAQARGIT